MVNNKLYGTTFYGNEASDFAKEKGYLDYGTLAKAFDAILSNDIIQTTSNAGIGYWEIENGTEEYYEDTNGNIYTYDEKEEHIEELQTKIEELKEFDTEETKAEILKIQEDIKALEKTYYHDIFQYFIISENGVNILKQYTNEIIFYNATLNMYVWGITHYGTSWDYILTNIQLNCGMAAIA